MGAWGIGNFENDDALDWLFQLDKAVDITPLREEFERVLALDEQPESPDAAGVLAAGEILAALRGKPMADEIPEDAQKYIERVSETPTAEIVEIARKAISRIREDSELRELWQEEESEDEWLAIVDDLLNRLG